MSKRKKKVRPPKRSEAMRLISQAHDVHQTGDKKWRKITDITPRAMMVLVRRYVPEKVGLIHVPEKIKVSESDYEVFEIMKVGNKCPDDLQPGLFVTTFPGTPMRHLHGSHKNLFLVLEEHILALVTYEDEEALRKHFQDQAATEAAIEELTGQVKEASSSDVVAIMANETAIEELAVIAEPKEVAVILGENGEPIVHSAVPSSEAVEAMAAGPTQGPESEELDITPEELAAYRAELEAAAAEDDGEGLVEDESFLEQEVDETQAGDEAASEVVISGD